MWTISIIHTAKHDEAMTDRWKSDMDGILIYVCFKISYRFVWNRIYIWPIVPQTGVFSATVAAFLIESYKYLKPDSTDVSARLLQQVTQELASLSNGDHFTPPTLDAFQAPRFAIHVNILWFLSLCMSLACGLGATLVQQWVRRYLRLTQRSDTPVNRVRVRTFLYQGIQDFHVNWVVENISVMLHAAIFLFFAGLVEFLFAFNDEVADVVLVAVSIFTALYISLTFLPVIYRQCPFQTPLTSILWYSGHIIAIVSMYLFSCSSHIRVRIEELKAHFHQGIDLHLMNMMKHKSELDKDGLQTTLGMCREDGELEAFIDAIPGYLETGHDDCTHVHSATGTNAGTRIGDIGFLLESKGSDTTLRHRLGHLFSSCTSDHRRIDEETRRRRAITCSRAVWEISKASLTVREKGVTLDMPKSLGDTLHRLSADTDPAIAVSALRTRAVFKRAITERILEADTRRDPNGSKESITALAEVVSGLNDPHPLLPYQPAEQRSSDPFTDGRLNTVTEFTSSILVLVPHLGQPSHRDLEETKMTLEELCRGLNGRTFPHDEQQRLVDILSAASHAHAASGGEVSTGTLCLL
jgi:hypothetical protein